MVEQKSAIAGHAKSFKGRRRGRQKSKLLFSWFPDKKLVVVGFEITHFEHNRALHTKQVPKLQAAIGDGRKGQILQPAILQKMHTVAGHEPKAAFPISGQATDRRVELAHGCRRAPG